MSSIVVSEITKKMAVFSVFQLRQQNIVVHTVCSTSEHMAPVSLPIH
jgi:hypothetical protein